MTDSVSRRSVLKNIALVAGTAAAAQALDAYATTAAPAKPAPKPAPAPKAAPAAKPPAAPAAAPAAAAAGGLPHLEESDPAAKALGYVSDVKKVDPKTIPTHVAGAQCANCVQLQGKVGDEWRPCNMFPKKLVHQSGWCKVYSKKPGAA